MRDAHASGIYRKARIRPGLLTLLLVVGLCKCHQNASAGEPSWESIQARAASSLAANKGRYAGQTNIMLRPGLVADKEAHTVTIEAQATGLGSNEVAEFLLIAPPSGHGYEAFVASCAAAGDVHAALVFIGLMPGVPYEPAKLRFWPKGERVTMTVAYQDARGETAKVRAEEMIRDERTGMPMRKSGFVFVGSRMVETGEGTNRAYAADVREPRSIASSYNESDTVLDVPRQAVQGDVYKQQTVNGDFVFTNGQPLQIVLEPEYHDGRLRVVDVEIKPAVSPEANGISGLRFSLTRDGEDWLELVGLNDMLAGLTGLVEGGHDPYVTLVLPREIQLADIQAFCRILNSIETETGIRVEPPPAGQLYYRAYLPNETFRTRAERVVQPCELLLHRDAEGKTKADLVEIEQHWIDNSGTPELIIQTNAIPSPAALAKSLETKGELPVLLIFADPATTHGGLLDYITHALPTHPTVHVYIGEPK